MLQKFLNKKKLKLNLSFVEKLMIIETKIILNQLIMKLKKQSRKLCQEFRRGFI